MSGRGAHRLDLAMRGIELLERALAEQVVAVPYRPQRHGRIAQPRQVEGEHGAGWRILERRAQVQLDQRNDTRMRQVVANDAKAGVQFSVSCGSTPHRWLVSTNPPRPWTSK